MHIAWSNHQRWTSFLTYSVEVEQIAFDPNISLDFILCSESIWNLSSLSHLNLPTCLFWLERTEMYVKAWYANVPYILTKTETVFVALYIQKHVWNIHFEKFKALQRCQRSILEGWYSAMLDSYSVTLHKSLWGNSQNYKIKTPDNQKKIEDFFKNGFSS